MAVFTPLSESALTAFLQHYNLGALVRFEGIERGVENSNFHLWTDQGRFILTLFEKRIRPEDVPFFLELKRHLASRDFPCPRPLPDRHGALSRPLEGKIATIVTFLEGGEIHNPSPAQARALGQGIARLHQCGADFNATRDNTLGPASWPQLLAQCVQAPKPPAQEHQAFLSATLERLDPWPDALPFGLCHADLFPDNVFYQDGAFVGFIDFYFACHDFYAYDLAVTLNAWCFNGGHFDSQRAAHILQGYDQHRPLLASEIHALPTLAEGAALRFHLTRLHDWLYHPPDALLRPKDPQPFCEIIAFHQANPSLFQRLMDTIRG